MYIYTLTTIKRLPDESFYDSSVINEYSGNRCIGFYKDCDDVLDIVLHDSMIWENGYYQYACIEKIKPCTYPIDFNPLWMDSHGNIIDTPKRYKNVCCIGIG
jgi:hypothetical protein